MAIKVGGLPHDLGLDPKSRLLFISNTKDGSQQYVGVLDAATNRVLDHYHVAKLPHRIALDPVKNLAYVVSVGTGIISKFNTITGKLEGTLETGGQGTIAFSPLLRKLFIPARIDLKQPGPADAIRIIDIDSGVPRGVIPPFPGASGRQAFGIAIDEMRRLLYATIGDSNMIGVADIDTMKPLGTFQAADCGWAIKLDPMRGLGFVTGATDGTLSIFSLNEVEAALNR